MKGFLVSPPDWLMELARQQVCPHQKYNWYSKRGGYTPCNAQPGKRCKGVASGAHTLRFKAIPRNVLEFAQLNHGDFLWHIIQRA